MLFVNSCTTKKGKWNSKIKGTILILFIFFIFLCHWTNLILKPWTSSSHQNGIPPPNTLIWGVGGKKSNFWTWAHCFIIHLELMNKHQLDEFTFGVGLLHALPIQRKAQKSFSNVGSSTSSFAFRVELTWNWKEKAIKRLYWSTFFHVWIDWLNCLFSPICPLNFSWTIQKRVLKFILHQEGEEAVKKIPHVESSILWLVPPKPTKGIWNLFNGLSTYN